MKIAELESKISKARVIDTSKLATDKILLYSHVEIENIDTGTVANYILVPDSEANIADKKISVSSPIGKGLLGKKVNDIASINIPSGVINFKVLSISRS